MTWNLGIDIGGTNFALGAVNEKGKIQDFIEHPVLESRDLENASKIIFDCANKLINTVGKPPKSIGAGVPGLVDFANQTAINLPHFPAWKNAPVGRVLSDIFGRKVVVDNDANLAALAELKFGKGQNLKDFVFMTLGTGIGGGLIFDGKIFRGKTGFAGEIGHIIINENDKRPCPCGGRGCFEMHASGKSVPYIFEFIPKNHQIAIKDSLNGAKLSSKTAFDLALLGNESAKILWKEFGYWLGIGIASLANTLGSTNYILGGNVSTAFEFFHKKAFDTAKNLSHVLRYSELNIIKSDLGPMAGIIGASQLT